MKRLMSLDAFRGATIASMILVNNAGDWKYVYPPLKHAEWNGWTFTDTVFPFFLWIVGMALTLSTARRVDEGADKRKLLLHTLRRAALIFLLGLFLNGFPYFALDRLRIPGVLQRIAVCYLIASVIFLYTRIRGQMVAIVLCLASYWMLMTLTGYPLERGNNFAAAVDQMFLSGHMYSATKTWDPEGIVSTLPAIATVLFGVLAGHMMRRPNWTPGERASWMFAAGSALLLAGTMMDWALPINKNIWTSSYAVFMAGLAMNCFAFCYWMVDVQGYQRWARPFVIYGMNAIVVYVLSGLVARLLGIFKLKEPIMDAILRPLASPHNASMLYGVANVLVLYLVAWFMYRRKWFVRL